MYEYQKERTYVFSEEGQVQFLSIRDRVKRLLDMAGACTMTGAIRNETGSSWQMMACVDRLVELGEIREITGPDVCGQDRVFVKAYTKRPNDNVPSPIGNIHDNPELKEKL